MRNDAQAGDCGGAGEFIEKQYFSCQQALKLVLVVVEVVVVEQEVLVIWEN